MVKGWRLNGEELCEATFTGLGAKDMLLRHDAKEKHLALLFEYGHTVGHALELTDGVHTSHGEGVTVGMLAASFIANRMGIMSDADRSAHDELVFALDPEVELPSRDIAEEVLEKVCHDNKRGYLPERENFCPFILARRVGEMHCPNKFYLEYVPIDLVREAISYVVDYLRAHPKAPSTPSAAKKSAGAPKSPSSIVEGLEGELSRGPTVEKCLKDMGASDLAASKTKGASAGKSKLAQLNAATLEGTMGTMKRRGADDNDASCSTTSSTGETEDDCQQERFVGAEAKMPQLSTARPLPMTCTTDSQVSLASKLDHPSTQGERRHHPSESGMRSTPPAHLSAIDVSSVASFPNVRPSPLSPPQVDAAAATGRPPKARRGFPMHSMVHSRARTRHVLLVPVVYRAASIVVARRGSELSPLLSLGDGTARPRQVVLALS